MNTTNNPPSVIDDGSFAVRRMIRIAAPLESVWTAITDPAHISRWFGRADFDGAGVGARGTLSWDDRGSIPLRIETIDEGKMISYLWSNDDALGAPPEELDLEHSTIFTFTLEKIAGATQLTVVESGFDKTSDPAANLESHRRGWNEELDSLVALLEETGA